MGRVAWPSSDAPLEIAKSVASTRNTLDIDQIPVPEEDFEGTGPLDQDAPEPVSQLPVEGRDQFGEVEGQELSAQDGR